MMKPWLKFAFFFWCSLDYPGIVTLALAVIIIVLITPDISIAEEPDDAL